VLLPATWKWIIWSGFSLDPISRRAGPKTGGQWLRLFQQAASLTQPCVTSSFLLWGWAISNTQLIPGNSPERLFAMPSFTRDDVVLHYELDGAGPPVVFITGSSNHSNDYLSQLLRQKFAPEYTVLVVDNRGSGQTTTPDGAHATIEDMADDIVAIMDHHQLGAAHVLGYSLGGLITLMLCLSHPEKVKSQVIAGSAARFPRISRPRFMHDTTRLLQDAGVPWDLVMRVAVTYCFSEETFLNPDFINAVVNAPPDPLRQSRSGFDLQLAATETFDVRARLGEIRTPTRVIYSRDDVLMPPHSAMELVENIPCAESNEFPGGHFFLLLPMNFEAFTDDVMGFWKRHS
jgi:pimeloyl-ACP methyl ester carboxylesterase